MIDELKDRRPFPETCCFLCNEWGKPAPKCPPRAKRCEVKPGGAECAGQWCTKCAKFRASNSKEAKTLRALNEQLKRKQQEPAAEVPAEGDKS